MPGKGTPRRTIRVGDKEWEAAKKKAEAEGRDVSDVVRECLDQYVSKDDKKR
ncbi:ribbon-helix-helix protein, CopG family [Actinomadura nitritigenes]|uniref:ribbon-helix-helix protein, CopG family n=1 Tax=Actinomadura nitritigenes TaxID=134602 RepID=UPI003D8ACCF1